MKLTAFLVIPLIAFAALTSIARGEDPKPNRSVEARLQAIEEKLDRIKALLRAATASPATTAGQAPQPANGQFKVTILGQVNRPGVYFVDPDTPILSLVALTQGYTRTASLTKVKIVSKDGSSKNIDVRKTPLAYKLQSGDVVEVPESYF